MGVEPSKGFTEWVPIYSTFLDKPWMFPSLQNCQLLRFGSHQAPGLWISYGPSPGLNHPEEARDGLDLVFQFLGSSWTTKEPPQNHEFEACQISYERLLRDWQSARFLGFIYSDCTVEQTIVAIAITDVFKIRFHRILGISWDIYDI